LQVEKAVKKGISGSQALVMIEHDHHHHHHRHLSHITEIINKSDLAPDIKHDSLRIFNRIAEAEAKVHNTTVEHIHFHEVGAMDSIIDVVGAVIGIRALGIEKIYCSPLHVGSGTVTCAHGNLPVPAPATAELVKGKPIYATEVQGELLTPTGAAILTTLAESFGPMPPMTVEAIGLGAGTSDPAIANLLRVFIGGTGLSDASYEVEQTAVIETAIDDMEPQIFDYLFEKILAMGALDVYCEPVQMKKNRGGVLLTILCSPDRVTELSGFLFEETTTIGLRWRMDNRIKAQRKNTVVTTRFGEVHCKLAQLNTKVINVKPEYDDCKRIALEHNVPLKTVMEEARAKAIEMRIQGDFSKDDHV
jgi:uncharacterized protein (TIGR00299 family) protein